MSNPDAFRAQAPQAFALVEATISAKSLDDIGRLLSGKKSVPAKVAPPEKPAGPVQVTKSEESAPAARIGTALLGRLTDASRGKGPQDVPVLAPHQLPATLQMFGSNARPVTVDAEHLRHILNTHPDVTLRDIAALPDLLQRPRAVLQHKGGGLQFILDARDAGGNPLLAALNQSSTREGGLKVTEVATVYGWDESASKIVGALQKGNALYLSQEGLDRVRELLSTGTTPAQSADAATTSSAVPGREKGLARAQDSLSRAPIAPQSPDRSGATTYLARPASVERSAQQTTMTAKAVNAQAKNNVSQATVYSDRAVRAFQAGQDWRSQKESISVPGNAVAQVRGLTFRMEDETAAQPLPTPPVNETPQQAAQRVDGAVKNTLQFAADTKNWALLKGGFTLAIANVYKKHLPSLERYVALVRRGHADRAKAVMGVDSIMGDFHQIASAAERGTGRGSVNAFLKDSTRSRLWGFMPDWLPAGTVKVDAQMQARFKAMSPQAQKVIQEVFRHGHDATQLMRQQALDSFAHDTDVLIEQYRKQGNTAELRKAENQKLRSVETFDWLADLDASWPYAPLKRFGEFVVVGRSKALMEQEAIMNDRTADDKARAAARARVREMRKDGNHYGVWFRNRREGRALAEQVRADARFKDGQVEAMAREDRAYTRQGDMLSAFHRLRDMVDNSTDSALREKSSAALDRLMADLHLSLLSEQSARQSGRLREDVLGADDDMMKAFDSQARAMANFTASLQNTREIQQVLSAMRDEVRDGRNAGTAEERMDVFNEILRRHAMAADTQTGPWNELVGKLMSGTSVWMLLTSISYHVSNATQPWAMSMPVMAAKHGYWRSQAALMQAYKDVAPALRDGRVSQDDFARLPKDVRAAVQQLADDGVITISMSREMGEWNSADNPTMAKIAYRMNRVAQATEALNRLATAVAAVRLEHQKGVSDEKAVTYARDIINQTHGEYAAWNAPRVMNTPFGRLATQFRKFQLVQLSLWVRMVHDSFRHEDATTRAMARRAALYSLGHMGALGGVVGMPGFAFLAFVLDGLMGGDDEPWDTEQELRKLVGDSLMGQVITRGAPFAMGADVSGRVGAGNMLSILPFTDIKPSKEGAHAMVAGAMGPFLGGIVPRAMDGLGLATQGQTLKGLEMMMPKGIADLSKALRQEVQGVTNRKGDVVLSPDELSMIDGIMQGIGFPTTTVTERGYKAGVKYRYEQFIKQRTAALQRQYQAAAKAGDEEGRAQVAQEWMQFQQSLRANGLKPQPLGTLMRSVQAQAKRERDTIDGIQFNKKNRRYVENLVGADADADEVPGGAPDQDEDD